MPHCLLLLTCAMPLASCYPFLKGFLRYSFCGYRKDSVEDILCGFLYEHILENFLSGLTDILKRTGLLPKNGLVLVVNIVSHKTNLRFLFGLPAKKCNMESGSPVSRCIAVERSVWANLITYLFSHLLCLLIRCIPSFMNHL